MYRPEKPAPTTTASNWSGTEAGLFTRRYLPRISHATGACWALPLTLTQLHKCAHACRSNFLVGRSGRAGKARARLPRRSGSPVPAGARGSEVERDHRAVLPRRPWGRDAVAGDPEAYRVVHLLVVIPPGIGVGEGLGDGLVHRAGAVEGDVVGGGAVRIVGAANEVPAVVVPALILDLDRPAGLAVHGRGVHDHLLAGTVEVIEHRCLGRDGAQAGRAAGLCRKRQRQRCRGGDGGQGELSLTRELHEEPPVRGQRSSPASTACTRTAGLMVRAWLMDSFDRRAAAGHLTLVLGPSRVRSGHAGSQCPMASPVRHVLPHLPAVRGPRRPDGIRIHRDDRPLDGPGPTRGRQPAVPACPRAPACLGQTASRLANRLIRNDARATTIMAPIIAPTMPPQSNLFVSPMPNRPWKIQKPTSAPNRPSPAEVSHDLQPRMCRKASLGIRARAIAPATKPSAKAARKLPRFIEPPFPGPWPILAVSPALRNGPVSPRYADLSALQGSRSPVRPEVTPPGLRMTGSSVRPRRT